MKKLSEADFATQIEDLLTRFGWKWLHIKPAQTGKGAWVSRTNPEGVGWPDYFAVKGDTAIAIELKSDGGILTAEQHAWLQDLRDAGILCYLWQPRDSMDSIMGVLR